MRTITTLLKNLLRKKQPDEQAQVNQKSAEAEPIERSDSDNQQNSLTSKQNDHERENDENPRHSGMDNPDAGKDSGTDTEEAYRRGLIDGRNSKIEEIYFPCREDGVPQFRGSNSREISVSDIFSVARNA